MGKDWKDPYYKYIVTKRKKPVTIDVTASIPPFKVPSPSLSDVVADFKVRKFKTVLDFGAGKLRNSIFLLEQNFKVWAVEFKEAFETPAGKQRLEEAKNFGKQSSGKKFFYLEYPKDFFRFNKTLDAALLINVVNIISEESHRKKILRACAKHIRPGGMLLFMVQYGEPHYRPGVTKRLKLKDGWCYGLHKARQTFYKPYSIPEIKSLIPSRLFKEERKIVAAHHRAFLFQRK